MKDTARWPVCLLLAWHAANDTRIALTQPPASPLVLAVVLLGILCLYLLNGCLPRILLAHRRRVIGAVVLAGTVSAILWPDSTYPVSWGGGAGLLTVSLFTCVTGLFPFESIIAKRRACVFKRRRAAASAELSRLGPDAVLALCRKSFGPSPRLIPLPERSRILALRQPRVWRTKDPLSRYLHGRDRLWREGIVVWGQLIKANEHAFLPGRWDYPGDVVYCLDPGVLGLPFKLPDIARTLFEMKDSNPEDADLKDMADHMTDEYTRVFGLKVPDSVSPWFQCAVTTILIHRKHLPDGKLSSSYFPLVVSLEEPKIAMILPCRYWPKPLQIVWHH